jgi:N-carbamoyl-L-amino-acid hydrolase
MVKAGSHVTITLDRRMMVLSLGAGLAAAGGAWSAPDGGASLRIDPDRLRQSLEALSVFGRPAGGDFSSGVSRHAYSDADVAGRAFAMGLIEAAGAKPRLDAAGNIWARVEGGTPGLKPLIIGSHIDSVPGGGNFDGALGSMAALEVLRTLTAKGVRLRHPLEVVLWSNEEGGTIGSGLATGILPPQKTMDVTLNGIRRSEGLKKIGGDPDNLASAILPKGSVAAYLELHIEQSGLLEKAGVKIGVVDGIVAIDEYEVEIQGVPNHAGTTPMAERRNALLAAAKLIEAVQEEVTREPGRQVGTVGHLELTPNARNIIPGHVSLNIELRDLDAGKIEAIAQRIAARAATIAAETRTAITMTAADRDPPALADPVLQRQIELAAASLGLSTMHLPSGAGHDAGSMAAVGPMAMIFAPSVAGVSHSPKELTHWEDCANGANVLLQTLLRVDAALAA